MDSHIRELEVLTAQHTLSDIEFDVMCRMLAVFKNGIDEMTILQKRAAIRALICKVVWDGSNAHVLLFGAQDTNPADSCLNTNPHMSKNPLGRG